MGQTLTATVSEIERSEKAISWTVSGITNAPSTKPSEMTGTALLDSAGYMVSSSAHFPTSITNRREGTIINYSLEQGTLNNDEVTTYKLYFTPVNALTTTSSIFINYPSQVVL